MTRDEFNTLLDEPAVLAAIREAEARSTGEVRVLVTPRVVAEALVEARHRFAALGMERTVQRNGVLIFIAPRSRTFAIVGDVGIHERGGEGLWQEAAAGMGRAFRAGEWTEGVVGAIRLIGDELGRSFPAGAECGPNELPDAIVREPEEG